MTLTMGLRRSLAMDAGAEALVSDEARLTRHEMVDRVARLAAALRDLGMQEGDRVAMLARNAGRLADIARQVPSAKSYVCDVSDQYEVDDTIDQVEQEMG